MPAEGRVHHGFQRLGASQVVFHTIFGTFKEDFGILRDLTSVGDWKTRQDIGKGFSKTKDTSRKITLPKMKYYAKLCSSNQSDFHTSNVGQVASATCFSGARRVRFGNDFYMHMSRDKSHARTAKTMNNIISIWSSYITEILTRLKNSNDMLNYGTKKWCEMASLKIGKDGMETDQTFDTTGNYFLTKS